MSKTSQLTELTVVDTGDLIAVSDISAGQSKKVTALNFMRSLVGGLKSNNIDITVADLSARAALSAVAGMIIYRIDAAAIEIFDGTNWFNVPRLLKRVALTSTGTTISVTGIPDRDAYTAKVFLKSSGGTMFGAIRFNNDSGTNYAQNASTGGGAYAVAVSGSSLGLFAGAESYSQKTTMEITNISGDFKTVDMNSQDMFGTDASTSSNFYNSRGKWANTGKMNRMDVVKAGGTGIFAIGSYAEIYG